MTSYRKDGPLQVAFKDIDRNALAAAIRRRIHGKNPKRRKGGRDGRSTRNWLDQAIAGHISMSPSRAKLIEELTDGKVPASLLRPDIFR